MPAPQCNCPTEAKAAVTQDQSQRLESVCSRGQQQQLSVTQVAPLTIGLFRKILVPLDLKSNILGDLSGPLRVLEDSTDQLMRLGDPTGREATTALPTDNRQRP